MYKNNILISVVLLFLVLNGSNIYCFLSSSWTESGDVITLTNQNFNSKVKQYDVLLIMFYVKWCSHCQKLHSEYEEAGTKLAKNMDPPIYIAKFDCTNSVEAQCSIRYNVHGYPTLKIYRYGRYFGEELNSRNRTTDELVKTMKTLKNSSKQQEQKSFISGQTDGVKDGMNKATSNEKHMWLLFIGLLCDILQNYMI